tara:strand:+ start:240 stop:1079 length:840 start_codon:yes stop_codon:yes gene_type:complete
MANNLGKGLEALIKSYSTDKKEEYLNQGIDISCIIPNKNQPRQVFDDTAMLALIESVKMRGILQPISVRKIKNNKYEIIAGERRYRAALHAKLKKIPAYIIEINNEIEMMEYALIENIQRVNLNPIEEAEGYAILSGKYNLTHALIAKSVSKSRTEISNKLRLLKLPPKIKNGLQNGDIEYGHARALLALGQSTLMIKLFNNIITSKLSVRQTESLINKLKIKKKIHKNNLDDYGKYETVLQNYLNTKIIIKNKKNVGKIIIEFSSEKKLKKIIKKISS